jgi:GAF domain-containing protein
MESNQPIYIVDTWIDPHFAGLGETHFRTWLGLPLSIQGNVIGVIALEKLEPNYY